MVNVLTLGKNVLNRFFPAKGVWNELLNSDPSWPEKISSAKGGKKILMATSLGGYDNGTLLESILGVALTLRGAEVHMLLCDQALPACQMSKISKIEPGLMAQVGTRSICGACQRNGSVMYKDLGLPVHYYSQNTTSAERSEAARIVKGLQLDDISGFEFEGLKVGEHAMAGALRYFSRGDIEGEEYADGVVRKYLEAALITVFTMRNLLRREKFDVACFHHGIYIPQGIIGEVCRQEGVHVVNSNPAYKNQTFIFSHNDTYHHTMVTEDTAVWEALYWPASREEETLRYLKSRWAGTDDWIWFHESPEEDVDKIGKELGIDFSKPTIALLTSVMWDAQLHYVSNAFPSMLDWVIKTIRYFAGRPDLQLVIRIHPAEVRGMIPSRQRIADEIEREFPQLPANVFIVRPENSVSTYALVQQCKSTIIYNTKTGIEIASMGLPVIVAGEAWIRNKGFSVDASNQAEYFRILDDAQNLDELDSASLELARKYAYHFFFRRMIPLPFIKSGEKFEFSLELNSINQLVEGSSKGLDCVCNGILNKTPFIYDA